MQPETSYKRLFEVLGVWLMRILVGSVFIMSGLTKLIDLWGFVFKIEDYLAAWDWDVPRTLVLVGGLLLSTFEFGAGVLLLTGCYRKVVTWLMMACMAFMLPLTVYIWIASPVSDCGCFGDFLVISNTATMLKNVVLVLLLVVLIKYNDRVGSVFHPSLQWCVLTVCVIYAMIIGLLGYNIQPVEDFRPFAPGKPLLSLHDEDPVSSRFIYEKDGKTAEFTIDEIPEEDSGWTFVDRIDESKDMSSESLTIYDPETGEDVSEEILLGRDSLLLIVIPEPARADLSYTYTINELSEVLANKGVETIGLLAIGKDGIDRWKDNSMASYDCFMAEDTQLKELARGLMSFVWLENDTVKWKRTISSIDLSDVNAISSGNLSVNTLKFDGHQLFRKLTGIFIAILLVLLLVQECGVTVKNQLHRWKNLCKFAK